MKTEQTGNKLTLFLKRWFFRGLWIFVVYFLLCILGLFLLKFFDPVTSSVQMQRNVASWFQIDAYESKFTFIAIKHIPPELQHAVVAAEDARFYKHWGIDTIELEQAISNSSNGRPMRGASTITQQFVKNMFLTTWRNPIRKIYEYPLTFTAEIILGKKRILELYLNIVEWGPGIFGVEAASVYHFGLPVQHVTRDQAARLAACLPSPVQRTPARMDNYSQKILARMERMGW